jgi:hypothetical protein
LTQVFILGINFPENRLIKVRLRALCAGITGYMADNIVEIPRDFLWRRKSSLDPDPSETLHISHSKSWVDTQQNDHGIDRRTLFHENRDGFEAKDQR